MQALGAYIDRSFSLVGAAVPAPALLHFCWPSGLAAS